MEFVFLGYLWVLWRERDMRCFEGHSSLEVMMDRVKFCALSPSNWITLMVPILET